MTLLLILLVVAALFAAWRHHSLGESPVKRFWAPALNSNKPVLLCLPKPMVYKPSGRLFEKYEKVHPNTSLTREARQDEVLPLEPTDVIQWADMVPIQTSGPGIGGVMAAVNLTQILTEQNIPFELRFGQEATYAEMRGSPVVIIGAINTAWATQLLSGAAFVFDQTIENPNIHESAGAKRVWKIEGTDGNLTRDYGLITRQMSGKSGQFLVQVAGFTHFGTAAASEILLNDKEVSQALRSNSVSLGARNLQIVVSTDVTNQRSGPPHIVAVSS